MLIILKRYFFSERRLNSRFCTYLFLFVFLSACARKNTSYKAVPSPVYDAYTTAEVVDPEVSGGKYSHSHSLLKFTVHGKTYWARSYSQYGSWILEKGDLFVIKYDSRDPSKYNIRFDEPVFDPSAPLAKTTGVILAVSKAQDTVSDMGEIQFVYEVNNNAKPGSGNFYTGFKNKYLYIKANLSDYTKPGAKYVVYYQRNHPQRAILHLDSIADSDHTEENYLLGQAEEREIQERYKLVIKQLTQFLNAYPSNAQALYLRGKAYYQLDRNKNAEKDFSDYIQRNPGTFDGYFFRTLINVKLGKLTQALEDINNAIAINSDTEPELYYYRGIVYYMLEDYDLAIEEFSKAIQMNPTVAKYYYNRAAARVNKTGNSKAGHDDYEVAQRMGIKESGKAMQQTKVNRHAIIAEDIKEPWSAMYVSFTTETGVMPCKINASSASVSFPYTLQDKYGNITQMNFHRNINFSQTARAPFTTLGLEVGHPASVYFTTRFAPVWGKAGFFWDLGVGYNLPLWDERKLILRPEVSLSYFEADYSLGKINYGKNLLSVPGRSHWGYSKDSYANTKLLDAVWSVKPRFSIWFYPKNLISFKINAGYVFPFGETGKYKVDFVYSPYSKHGSTGFKSFNPVYSTSSDIGINKLYNVKGFFAGVEFVIRIP